MFLFRMPNWIDPAPASELWMRRMLDLVADRTATIACYEAPVSEWRGIRVINLFTGPLDTEWFQSIPPPKLAPRALAAAVIKTLRAGTEDVFVGDIAEDIRRRLESNPKALERELGQ
jgi:hypothetical protein